MLFKNKNNDLNEYYKNNNLLHNLQVLKSDHNLSVVGAVMGISNYTDKYLFDNTVKLENLTEKELFDVANDVNSFVWTAPDGYYTKSYTITIKLKDYLQDKYYKDEELKELYTSWFKNNAVVIKDKPGYLQLPKSKKYNYALLMQNKDKFIYYNNSIIYQGDEFQVLLKPQLRTKSMTYLWKYNSSRFIDLIVSFFSGCLNNDLKYLIWNGIKFGNNLVVKVAKEKRKQLLK